MLESRIFSKTAVPTILLLDEIDMIAGRDRHVLYKFYDWATTKDSKLYIIAISNTSNLPYTFDDKIKSRMGMSLTSLKLQC